MASFSRVNRRNRIKISVRKKVRGTEERPRLCVYRSNNHIYVQVIDDLAGSTLVAASSLSKSFTEQIKGKKPIEVSKLIGAEIARLAIGKNIKNVVFDRNGYLYHGRVKAVADGAREAGLNF